MCIRDRNTTVDLQSVYVIKGLGGRSNFKELDCCVKMCIRDSVKSV